MSAWPFGDLPRNHFGVIYADPPWHFTRYSETQSPKSKGRAPQDHYSTMTTEEIAALPVADLAGEDCVLCMWTTWPHARFAFEIIERWGFTYKTCAFCWLKADVSTVDMFSAPKDADMFMGYWTRANSEPCLLATRGTPKRLYADVRQGIIEPKREHSRKPSVVYERIERLVSGPYLELFARNTRKGWSSWGNQTSKFGEVA